MPQGKHRAVTIGVNSSQSLEAMSPLRYAERDAADLADVLTHSELGTSDSAMVDLLTGVTASCANVKRDYGVLLAKRVGVTSF